MVPVSHDANSCVCQQYTRGLRSRLGRMTSEYGPAGMQGFHGVRVYAGEHTLDPTTIRWGFWRCLRGERVVSKNTNGLKTGAERASPLRGGAPVAESRRRTTIEPDQKPATPDDSPADAQGADYN